MKGMITCLHTACDGYGRERKSMTPLGIVLHSTGANNPSLKRYVQPSEDDPKREELLSFLGVNRYGNHWNRPAVYKSVHYFIGQLASGEVGTVKVLPDNIAAWGVGRGKHGSYNYDPTGHLQIEVCEDALRDKSYFYACYRAAVSLCASLCRQYGFEAAAIVSHREAHDRGYASAHRDIDHWLSAFGLTMDDFRREVAAQLAPPRVPQVGDLVQFHGTKHYRSAGALLPAACRPGKARITRIYRLGVSRHPYHLIKVTGDTSTVYGWVDEGSFTVLS